MSSLLSSINKKQNYTGIGITYTRIFSSHYDTPIVAQNEYRDFHSYTNAWHNVLRHRLCTSSIVFAAWIFHLDTIKTRIMKEHISRRHVKGSGGRITSRPKIIPAKKSQRHLGGPRANHHRLTSQPCSKFL